MALGMEMVGLAGVVATLLGKAVVTVDRIRTVSAQSAENKLQCAALALQLAALTKRVEELQCAQAAELDALGPLWTGALGQLVVDLAAAEKKLRRLASPKRRSNALAENVTELKHAGEVSSALLFAEEKLGVARGRLHALDSRKHVEATTGANAEAAATSQEHALAQLAGMKDVLRDQSRSLAVIEQVLNLSEGALSMARVTGIVKAAPVPALGPDEARVRGHGQAQGRTGAAGNMHEALFDDENELEKLEELQPRLVSFWRRLERGESGGQMSGEERRDMAELMKLLWAPWKLDRSAVQASPGFHFLGGGTYGVVTKGTMALKCCKVNVAVKVMQGVFSQDEFKADFFREASMLHRLRHPAIVTFYGAWWPDEEVSPASDDGSANGRDDVDADSSSDSASDESSDGGASLPEDSAAFVMERMDGDVGELVNRGKISAREDLLSIFVDSAQGLLHLHEHGVIHLEMKPENILACVAGGASGCGLVGRAKITGFGVSLRKKTSHAPRCARESQRQWSTRGIESGVGVAGTLAFMAPETLLRSDPARGEAAGDADAGIGARLQAQRESCGGGLSFACDVYSLGITICRVMQLHLARAGNRIALPATFVGSEGNLAAASRSGALAADVERWVREVLWEDAEMALRDLVLACVQTRPCDRPSMAAVLVVLEEMKSSPGGPSGRGSRDIERAAGSCEMSATSILALGAAYRNGTGVRKDAGKAFSLISRSADMGSVAALECLASLYASGVGVARDCAKAHELYQRAADGGDIRAVYNLGVMYEEGSGVAKDCAKARELYQRAADGGDMRAVCNLGEIYEKGSGVGKDCARARELYQRAADGGYMRAVCNLGSMYFYGNAMAKDFAKAHELYQRAADGGSMLAVSNLGSMFVNGNGVAKDFAKARELFQRAADSGNTHAVTNLGWLFVNGIGVAKDFAKARTLYERAADGGNTRAVCNLGYMYFDGIGVAKDFAKARELFLRAAKVGDMRAVFYLGKMFFKGNGVSKDPAKARELYQRAADGGNMTAVINLGWMFQNGIGVARDVAKARELYQRAADGGDMRAVCNLGVMYNNGNGVTKDCAKARELYQRAADGGNVRAVSNLRRMNEHGDGGTKDSGKARELYQRAADGGITLAAARPRATKRRRI